MIPSKTDAAQQELDRLYKLHFGKLVSSLLNFSSSIDPDTAEDLVQDVFSSAVENWKLTMPDNPPGWLYRVSRNKAINWIKAQKKYGDLQDDDLLLHHDPAPSDSVLEDFNLRMLFACAHPDLSPKVQVIITLKYVVNLKVESISKIFGMTADGVDKLLVRARQKIKDEKILLAEPAKSEISSRLPIVHKIIYLVFNEGYKTSWGRELIREELCEEALLLNKIILDKKIGDNDTAALNALMLFNASRFKSRFGASGELLDLESQDRSSWNYDLIALGHYWLGESKLGVISNYHYEASIALLHCSAKSFKETNWKLISDLYAQLLKLNANPFVELNYAIALWYAGEKERALSILHELEKHSFMSRYYLLNASLGKFYKEAGNRELALHYFELTLGQTSFEAEKEYIRCQMRACLNP